MSCASSAKLVLEAGLTPRSASLGLFPPEHRLHYLYTLILFFFFFFSLLFFLSFLKKWLVELFMFLQNIPKRTFQRMHSKLDLLGRKINCFLRARAS